MSDENLKRTPLHDEHVAAGARMVGFAGWNMPVQYSGVIDEHRAVRGQAGLFDVSHMGEFLVSGPGAEAYLDRLTPNNVGKLAIGRVHYTGLLTERGTYLDDLLIYRTGETSFLLVVNAANVASDFEWMSRHAGDDVELVDATDDYALLALQGPAAAGILAGLTEADLDAVRYYGFTEGEVAGVASIISRTGYTGEDGFELYTAPEGAPRLWRALLEAGASQGLVPAGLGARDTLRLEAGMALYGHEIDDSTTPLEAGLGWVVKLAKGEFIGSEVLAAQKEHGTERKLIGFEVTSRGIARQGHRVLDGDRELGLVTSGTFSPTFEKALGMAYVPTAFAEAGQRISIEVRGRSLDAVVVDLPFYRRAK